MATDGPKQGELLPRLLEILDNRHEEKFYDSLSVDELCKELSLSRQELEVLVTPLLAKGWVEKDVQTAGGYFHLHFTPLGKQHHDRAKGTTRNEKVRQSLLELLAKEYEQSVHAITDSDTLAQQLALDWNKVCFNLQIMAMDRLVTLQEEAWAGHAYFQVSLTPEGKLAFDNPEARVVFLSHAALDEEIAKYLKQVIEASFPNVHVFVSTDPEDLRPGDPWVTVVLEKLAAARVLLVLATARGLTRKWVWFETGGGWARGLRVIPCCVGKVRKGQLPPPFSSNQAVNVDEEGDLQVLLDILAEEFGSPSQSLDLRSETSELVRLDVRVEERGRVGLTSGLAAEMRAKVEEGLAKLSEGETEAIRQLLLEGELTDRRAIELVCQKGLVKDNPAFIFPRIHSETGFVQQVWAWNRAEAMLGYQGPWRINPQLKPALEEFLFRKGK
jgi:DNA-binding MarR family transcriptional regulator